MGPGTLLERLEGDIAGCDRVIVLVGDAYGIEPSGDAVPVVDPPRSYTQWEYHFAMGERLNGTTAKRKDVYAYIASESFLREHTVEQSPEHAKRQRDFTLSVRQSGKDRREFDSVDQLCRWVLRDVGWRGNRRMRWAIGTCVSCLVIAGLVAPVASPLFRTVPECPDFLRQAVDDPPTVGKKAPRPEGVRIKALGHVFRAWPRSAKLPKEPSDEFFFIAEREVKGEQFNRFLQARGGLGRAQSEPANPVVNVMPQNAVEYCKWLSGDEGGVWNLKLPTRIDLPTKSLWEKLCQDLAGPTREAMANGRFAGLIRGNYAMGETTLPQLSSAQVYDIVGSVAEIIRDDFGIAGSRFYKIGGSFRAPINEMSNALESPQPIGEGYQADDVGFRPVLYGAAGYVKLRMLNSSGTCVVVYMSQEDSAHFGKTTPLEIAETMEHRSTAPGWWYVVVKGPAEVSIGEWRYIPPLGESTMTLEISHQNGRLTTAVHGVEIGTD